MDLTHRKESHTEVFQVPLLEHVIDVRLQHSVRTRWLPVHFCDPVPTSTTPNPRTAAAQNRQLSKENGILEQQPSPNPRTGGIEDSAGPADCMSTLTNTNSFGVFQEYLSVSSHNPHNPDVFTDAQPTPPAPQSVGSNLTVISPEDPTANPLANSDNISEDLVLGWMITGAGNTPAGLNDLVHNIIRNPVFDPSALEDFNTVTVIHQFKWKQSSGLGAMLRAGNGWKEGSVRIKLPCMGVEQEEGDAPEFVVDGILYHDVVAVITAKLKDPDAFKNIHTTPYKEWWNPGPGEDPVRVYSEIYNSDTMLNADKEMREKPDARHSPEDNLETFIVSALLYSDSTHLASFGNASLWPIYLFLSNISKYIRSKPTTFSAHHITYIPTVSHCFPSVLLPVWNLTNP